MSRGAGGGKPLSLGRTELALAYELRAAGCRWKNIATGLGCSVDYLMRRVVHCESVGITWIKKP